VKLTFGIRFGNEVRGFLQLLTKQCKPRSGEDGLDEAFRCKYNPARRQATFDALEESGPNLRKKVLQAGAGHWIQQERPAEVNQLLIEFLASQACRWLVSCLEALPPNHRTDFAKTYGDGYTLQTQTYYTGKEKDKICET
jgi:hypothetical protein